MVYMFNENECGGSRGQSPRGKQGQCEGAPGPSRRPLRFANYSRGGPCLRAQEPFLRRRSKQCSRRRLGVAEVLGARTKKALRCLLDLSLVGLDFRAWLYVRVVEQPIERPGDRPGE